MSNPITQESKHSKCTNKYNFVSTQGIIDYLGSQGWTVRSTSIARSKRYDGFQKHVVRFINDRYDLIEQVGDSRPELVLINSHHGASSVRLMLGIYRMVCANGMIVGDTFQEYRIRHVGYTHEKLQKALVALMGQAESLGTQLKAMKAKVLTQGQAEALASKVALARINPSENESIVFNPTEILKPVRDEDRSMDLYTVLNVIQERLIRGGIRYAKVAKVFESNGVDYQIRTTNGTTRAVRAIDSDIELNKLVFTEAQLLLAA